MESALSTVTVEAAPPPPPAPPPTVDLASPPRLTAAADREAAIAAAAANRLGQNAVGHRPVGDDRAADLVGHCDRASIASRTAGAAGALGFRIGLERSGRRDREGAVAAAAADRLRNDAGALIAGCGDRRGIGYVHRRARASAAARTADRVAGRLAAVGADREAAREAAVAAAAADRLRENADRAGPVDQDRAGIVDRHRIGVAAAAARAAGRVRRGVILEAEGRADREAAVAAAAADRLGDDAVGEDAPGRDRPTVGDIDSAARAAAGAVAADRVAGAFGVRPRADAAPIENPPLPPPPPIDCATMPEALSPYVVMLLPERRLDGYRLAVRAQAARAADRIGRRLAAVGERQRAGEAAVAAAAADRLREDAVRPFAADRALVDAADEIADAGRDGPAALDGDIAREAARAAAAARSNWR